ncbi:polyprenyl synthetase family protein [Fictibacillus barbaricus]|uniref:Geranylgeranyl diphosphate synthase type II n=1 Tax=Fictibacillus barbaricus TaxID=182136 RepID=A0ABU1TZM9_9BACL|nr:farnesyl diphosphate synthase [Fictibacillus barbaricus]MDR7072678.1 geranylgeranyl diphosphate synthase type II [Fictibacillus barbaricus]
MSEFERYLNDKKKIVENRMLDYLQGLQTPENLKKAMIYSVSAGGKRLRPILTLAVMEAFQQNPIHVLDAACAVEFVHTYSLIHDDLPSMDDDDYRRGKLTSHKVFGEAKAILAGDALLTESFTLIADNKYLNADQKVKIISLLSASAGAAGMVGGQVEDIEGENKELSLAELESIHEKKTGKMLECSVLAGGIASGATGDELTYLKHYARHIGIAFQIQDDILDVTGNQEQLGKPIGSDEANRKTTYPKILGLEGAKKEMENHIEASLRYLGKINADTVILVSIADYIIKRNH